MRHTDAQIATLIKTVRCLSARAVNASPRAYDLALIAFEENLAALERALAYPLTAESLYRRRVDLGNGRYAEAFNSSGGTTYAVRNSAPAEGQPATEVCYTSPDSGRVLRQFRDTVLAEISR